MSNAYEAGKAAAQSNQNVPTGGSYSEKKQAEAGYWNEKSGNH